MFVHVVPLAETWIWNAVAYAPSQVRTTWQTLCGGAEVDLQPLRVAVGAGPAGAGVAVDRGAGRGAGVLGRARRWPAGPGAAFVVPQPPVPSSVPKTWNSHRE